MGNVTTSSSSSGSSNKNVNTAVNTFAKGLTTEYGKTPQVFDQSLYPGAGSTTQQGWNAMLGAANNPGYSSAIDNTIGEFGQIASGNRFGQLDPQYQQLRQKAMDDAVTNVGQGFNAAGRFGGGSYIDKATEAAGNVAAGMDLARLSQDEARQAQAAQMLPGLFQAGTLPASVIGQVGAAQDANALAERQGAFDLFTRKNDANWNQLSKASSILAGTAPFGGQTTSQEVPWWAAATGIGSTIAGAFL